MRRPLQNHSLSTRVFHAHPMGLKKTSLLLPLCACVCTHVYMHMCACISIYVCVCIYVGRHGPITPYLASEVSTIERPAE